MLSWLNLRVNLPSEVLKKFMKINLTQFLIRQLRKLLRAKLAENIRLISVIGK